MTTLIACLSDLHLQGAMGQDISFINFEKVLDLALADNPDFLLLTGDLVNGGDKAYYDHLIRHLITTGVPFALMAGNHDVTTETTPNLFQNPNIPYHQRTFGKTNLEPRLITRQCYNLGTWQLICLNSSIAGCEHGHINDDDLVWLAQTLSTSKTPTLLATHHHPIAVGSAWIDAFMLDNADTLFNLLSQYPHCRTLVSGHVHQAHTLSTTRENTTFTLFTNPACSRQFLPMSEQFALDDMPAGYRMLILHDTGDIDSYVKRLGTYS